MRIYIASSYRNLNAVLLLRDVLRSAGHEVLDWADKTPPPPDSMPVEERRRRFDSDEGGALFDFCANACGSADLVVYLGPAGQDAACEVGMAYVAGVPVFGIASPLECPGLILSRCVHQWFTEFAPFMQVIRKMDRLNTFSAV